MSAPYVVDEPARLAALRRLDILDTVPEAAFDKIVGLVRTVFAVPIATVTLVDEHRQWFKAREGLSSAETPRSASFCTHTVALGAPLIVENALLDGRVSDSPLVLGDPNIRSYLGVPLMTHDGHALGALCAIDTVPRTFTPEQVDLLSNFAKLVIDEFELRQIASTDQLTGALSRRGFLAALDTEIARCGRYDRPASLAFFDVDHFKRINDQHGHPAGDAVLRQLVARCKTMLRPVDLVGRLGGEEFAILLPETTPEAALATANRLRNSIANDPFHIGETDASLNVTVSFGVTGITAGDSADTLSARADVGLYRAKQGGRNRVEGVSCTAENAAA